MQGLPVGQALRACHRGRPEAEFWAHAQVWIAAGVKVCSVGLKGPLGPSAQHHMVQRPRDVVVLQHNRHDSCQAPA